MSTNSPRESANVATPAQTPGTPMPGQATAPEMKGQSLPVNASRVLPVHKAPPTDGRAVEAEPPVKSRPRVDDLRKKRVASDGAPVQGDGYEVLSDADAGAVSAGESVQVAQLDAAGATSSSPSSVTWSTWSVSEDALKLSQADTGALAAEDVAGSVGVGESLSQVPFWPVMAGAVGLGGVALASTRGGSSDNAASAMAALAAMNARSGPVNNVGAGQTGPADLSGLTRADIAALDPSVVAGWTAAQLMTLRADQVSGFTAAQIGVMAPDNFLVLSEVQIAALEPDSLAAAGPSTFAQLSDAKLASITAVQGVALGPVLVAALTPAQVAVLQPATFGALPEASIDGMTLAQLNATTPAQTLAMSAVQIHALSADQLDVIEPRVASLSATQIAAIDPAAFVALDEATIDGLSAAQVAAITAPQAGAMSVGVVAALEAPTLAALAPAAVAGLAPAALAAVSDTNFAALVAPQLGALTAAQGGALSAGQVATLDASEIAALAPASFGGLSVAVVPTLSALQLGALTQAQGAAMAPLQLQALSLAQVAALSPASVAGLLDFQLAAMSVPQLEQTTAAQIAAVNHNELDLLTPAQLAALDHINVAPVFATPSTVSAVNENVLAGTVVYTAASTDANLTSPNNALNYTLGGTDAASFSINALTGAVSVLNAPDFETKTSYQISVTAHDGGLGALTATQSVTVNVNDLNEAPTVQNALVGQPSVVNQPFVYVVPGTTFADPDAGANGAVAYSATLVGGAALPAWLTFNAATHTFSGTPAAGDAGTLNVHVTGTDGGGLAVSSDFALQVVSAPLITSAFNNAVVGNFDVTSDIVLTATENVTAETGKFIRIVNDGGVGFAGEVAVHSFSILATDPAVTIVGNVIRINTGLFDLDLANNYHIEIDDGAFKGVLSGQGSIAVSDVTAMDFATVTPGGTAIGNAVQSQSMNGTTGALEQSYKWLDVGGIGSPSSSIPVAMNASAGSYAFVFGDHEPAPADPGNGQDGVGPSSDFHLSVSQFGENDLLYIDDQFNLPAAANDLNSTILLNTGTAPTQVQFNSFGGGLGGWFFMALEGSTAGYDTLAQMTAYLSNHQPIVTG
ncbi:putative Ig domain-containing protein [Variovorax saccharolyticus]|uniref:putative Ig domain-containing protein n=1 Tax=Variovorax saccharolyticus TaxID=3053516 RepID=UPI0025751159|nr:putative Ig domain-containing protein [Variovorax sp. J31P216]MDM0029874.1 putative Ig domain-containing protein [Variovorax sp. J31P216]